MTLTRTCLTPRRHEGYADLEDYAAIGEGRSVALVGMDGAIDWWCAPNMDSPPLFDRLLDARHGGHFTLVPEADSYRVERRYRDNSNVLETCFITDQGRARITESINSNTAGRLPWCELARRVEGLEGEVTFRIDFVPGTRAGTVSPWLQDTPIGKVYNIGPLMVMMRHSDDVKVLLVDDRELSAQLTTRKGSRSMVALLAAEGEPLAVPPIDRIDERIDVSDFAWRDWAEKLNYDGEFKPRVLRSALALKFLLYSPSGAIAAAATTSLPEGIGGEKNYDYRYAWVRDACLVIKAFVHAGALEESKAAFSWLTATIRRHGPNMRACYTLQGELVPAETFPPLHGYRGSQPVRIGNNAKDQLQTSMYGDMLATASLFIDAGHVIDLETARLLGDLANQCADRWRQVDCGIWELPEQHHYTHSKMACWLALDHAVRLAEAGHIEQTWQGRWQRERDRIADWINTHCWSETRQAYTFYPGTDKLDAAMCLTHRFCTQVSPERMQATFKALQEELGRGPLMYRYSGAEQEEGAFLACSFWLVEALGATGQCDQATRLMQAAVETCDGNLGLMHEMIDPDTGAALGNFPQGLSHLAFICAANVLSGGKSEEAD
ncbi:glycoside hydrolase family 15 protein [Larsenimonas rhizosphaerae]|uniref:glycoside hydrolase family 15 protein n=1 Tax=Larsenimonas rhizosphaerae TaxID=2944682 RepID=UPI00203383EC|nr:glycoside hydrolase family 15 protein [Larsenimonas rhizosphaerae]MCM2131336.1 glycoside hydrolase family 15 protein [Larsenimonas rhizosphaerae]